MSRTAVLALCVLVLLAGCGGGGGGDGGTATTTAPATQTTGSPGTPTAGATTVATSTPTTGTTASPTASPTTTPPATGDLPANAGERHVDALRSAGSFTVETHLAFTNDSGTVFASDSRSELDLGAGRGYQNDSVAFQSSSEIVTERFTDGETTYERTAFGGDVQYRRATAPYDGTDVTPVTFDSVVGTVDENVSDTEVRFERTGTGTVDGVAVTRYRANDEDLAALYTEELYENATVTAAEMTLAVDAGGVFRRVAFALEMETDDGEAVTYELEQTITGVGSTAVADPSWLGEAQDRTG